MFTYLLTYNYTTLRAQELCESRGGRLCGRKATLNANSSQTVTLQSEPVWPNGKQKDPGSIPALRLSYLFKCVVGQKSSSYTVISLAVRSLGFWTLSLWLYLSQIMEHSNGSHRCPSDAGIILVVFNCCFTSTETVRNNRDWDPRTATSAFTQLLSLVVQVQCCITSTETEWTSGTGTPGRPPRRSHSS